MLDETRGGERLGICFDTCHAFSAGYDLSSDEGYDGVLFGVCGPHRLGAFAGVSPQRFQELLWAAASYRHEEIGDGTLGLLPFWCW